MLSRGTRGRGRGGGGVSASPPTPRARMWEGLKLRSCPQWPSLIVQESESTIPKEVQGCEPGETCQWDS